LRRAVGLCADTGAQWSLADESIRADGAPHRASPTRGHGDAAIDGLRKIRSPDGADSARSKLTTGEASVCAAALNSEGVEKYELDGDSGSSNVDCGEQQGRGPPHPRREPPP